jgi:hypothetical protein
LVHEFFSFCFPCSIFIFASPPHHFSNGPPLSQGQKEDMYRKQSWEFSNMFFVSKY